METTKTFLLLNGMQYADRLQLDCTHIHCTQAWNKEVRDTHVVALLRMREPVAV